eukprot:7313058-Pyramimonas_sp.AAC.1
MNDARGDPPREGGQTAAHDHGVQDVVELLQDGHEGEGGLHLPKTISMNDWARLGTAAPKSNATRVGKSCPVVGRVR